MYTLEDLEKAREELGAWSRRCDDYSGNNPDKYQADIKSARRQVEEIQRSLKASGVIEKTAKELLEERLDKAFPKAESKDIVEFEGKKFQLRFRPKEKSRSRKTVIEWHRWWEEIKDVQA